MFYPPKSARSGETQDTGQGSTAPQGQRPGECGDSISAGRSNSPQYYLSKSGRDVFEVARDFGLNFAAASALKYLVRAGRKTPDGREDIAKAVACLQRELAFLEAGL